MNNLDIFNTWKTANDDQRLHLALLYNQDNRLTIGFAGHDLSVRCLFGDSAVIDVGKHLVEIPRAIVSTFPVGPPSPFSTPLTTFEVARVTFLLWTIPDMATHLEFRKSLSSLFNDQNVIMQCADVFGVERIVDRLSTGYANPGFLKRENFTTSSSVRMYATPATEPTNVELFSQWRNATQSSDRQHLSKAFNGPLVVSVGGVRATINSLTETYATTSVGIVSWAASTTVISVADVPALDPTDAELAVVHFKLWKSALKHPDQVRSAVRRFNDLGVPVGTIHSDGVKLVTIQTLTDDYAVTSSGEIKSWTGFSCGYSVVALCSNSDQQRLTFHEFMSGFEPRTRGEWADLLTHLTGSSL